MEYQKHINGTLKMLSEKKKLFNVVNYVPDFPYMKEITGAKKGDNKARLCWCEMERTSEKKITFFYGEVFFS